MPYDVFISYAHRNNQPLAANDEGWVTRFKKTLEVLLGEKLNDPKIWMDPGLARNRPLDDQIMAALQDTRVLVVIVSQAYLESEWCTREREAFMQLVADKTNAGYRVFGILYDDLKEGDLPRELRNLLGWRFWTADGEGSSPRPLGRYPRVDEDQYYKQMNDLAAQMAKELKQLVSSGGSVPPRPKGPAVFLADVTDDLLRRQDEIRRFLNQAGIDVLPQPQVWYPQDDPDALEQAMLADLRRAKVFVQLLSDNAGKRPPFLPQGYPVFRAQVARRAGLPRLCWRSPDLDPAAIEDADLRALLEGEAQASGFEEFKQAIVTEARREPKPAPTRQQDARFVFVNADLPDRPIAAQLRDALRASGLGCALPLAQGSPEEVRQDLEESLRQCDGILFLYGDTTAGWLRTQQRYALKVTAGRATPVAAICVMPPHCEQPVDLDPILPGVIQLDLCRGLDLGPFVDRLSS